MQCFFFLSADILFFTKPYLVLRQCILNSLGSGLHRSRMQNQFVQPAQETVEALLDADRLGHSRLQLLSPFRHWRRKGAKPFFQTICRGDNDSKGLILAMCSLFWIKISKSGLRPRVRATTMKTCCTEDVNSFQGRRLVGADQIPSCSLHLLQLYRMLGQSILQKLKIADKILTIRTEQKKSITKIQF